MTQIIVKWKGKLFSHFITYKIWKVWDAFVRIPFYSNTLRLKPTADFLNVKPTTKQMSFPAAIVRDMQQ